MPTENDARRIMELLSGAGFSVVGPVDRTSTTLALAAQSPVNLAVAGSRLEGRRDGHELAGASDPCLRARAILAGDYDPPPAAA